MSETPKPEDVNPVTPDRQLLDGLARHLRKHDVGCFDYETDDQDRAEVLVSWLADNVEALNVPPRA